MYPVFYKRLPVVAFFLFCSVVQVVLAQEIKPVSAHVVQLQQSGAQFPVFSVFSAAPYKKPSDFDLKTQPLRLDEATLNRINSEHPELLSLELPWHGGLLRIDLYQAPVLADNFSVLTSGKESFVYTPGVYYRGIIENEPNSVAAISFFQDEVIGVIAHPNWGNLNLGRMDRPGNRFDYVLFSDQDIPERPHFECGDPFQAPGHIQKEPVAGLPEVSGCVQIYFECDYELFQNKGTVGNTINYVTGFFNVVSTLYANESISVAISQIFVWTTPDDYPITSSSDALDAFVAYRTSFNGNLAHLIGLGGGFLGGVAFLEVLCTPGYNYAYSNISSTYSNYPTYSWTVEVVTHETGHNLASNHTHWCGWSGGALDNCYTPEGGCSPGPPPTNGGTIMSYCHLTSYGINFANGFGTQPGNAIRAGVTNAGCLAATCPTSSCTAPTSLTVSSITSTSAIIGWNAVGGASSYNLQYRLSGTSSWTTVSSAPNPYTLTGLTPSSRYEVQVQSVCGGSSSPYFAGLIFMTSASACTEPSGIVVSGQTASTADVNWTENGSAVQWELQYGIAGFALGSGATVTANTKPYTITGLLAGTAYHVYVRAICGGGLGNSAWVGPTTFNTPVANDDPGGAILLIVDQACPGTNIYNNLGAGTYSGEFSPSIPNGGFWDTGTSNTVWFKFVAPTSGSVKITTDISPLGTLDDTEVALYNSSDPTSLDELLVSNEDGGTLGQGWATTLYYSGLTPGSMYYIQVDGWNTEVGSFCITVAQTFSIPNPGTTCTSYTQTLVNGSTAPDKWFNIYHKPSQYNIGQTVAAIKSPDDLGTVTVQEIRYSSVQSAPNGVKYMQRYYNVNCTQNQALPKQVRLFYTNTELSTYKTATGLGSNTADDLNISHFDGTGVEDCTPNNNSPGTTTLLTDVTATTIGSSGIFFLQFESPGFSEMAAIFGLTALPVELEYFKGKIDATFNRLEWATSYEKNIAAFALERSADGYGQWREIGRKDPATELKPLNEYFLDDLEPLARGYYRLKIIDRDGSTDYSNSVVLERSIPDGLRSLYPNPAIETLFAEYQASQETAAVFRLISADGRVVLEQTIEMERGLNILPFPLAGLPAGLYYLTIPGAGGQSFVKQ